MKACRRCHWRPIHSDVARRHVCLACAAEIDAERAIRARERAKFNGLPADFANRMSACDAARDPLALPLSCWCGRDVEIQQWYTHGCCESRFVEVCEAGHATPMRRYGTHTYDQHERAEREQERKDTIQAKTRATSLRNGVRPGFRVGA